MADNKVTLPVWLDDLIFKQLNGKYCRSNCDMNVINWTPEKILDYLGTYFPRSFAESYCIFKQLLNEYDVFKQQSELKMLDFGCGTGGEIIGIATAIAECRPNIKVLNVKAIDGNLFALRRYENIRDEFNNHFDLKIKGNPTPVTIDDFYDLSILDSILDDEYDLMVSFKAICEFVTEQQFKEKNAYEHLARFMLPHLSEDGLMLLADITSKNNVVKEWLPMLMDKGLANAGVSIAKRNEGFNETFLVSHSRYKDDQSKIAWRVINK